MPYIGRGIETLSDRVVLDSLTASATASYTLQLNSVNFVPSSASSLTVSLNGVIQKPESSYTVSGSTLTFSSSLTSSDSIDFIIAERDITLQTPSAGSVGTSQLASNAVTAAKINDGEITNAKINSSAAIATTKLGAGAVLQVVSTTKTSTFQTSSASMVSVTGFNAAITPSSTSSKIYVMVTCGTFINDNGNARALMQVLRGSTNITAGDAATGDEVGSAVCARSNDGGHHQFPTVISVLDSPSTTSATTYKIQVSRGADAAGTVRLNRSNVQDSNSGNTISTLTLMEIAG